MYLNTASAGSATTRRARLTAARRDSHRTQSLNDDVRGRVQQSQPVAAGEPRGERALAAADSSPHPSGRRQRRPRGDARDDQQRQRRRGIVLGTRRGHPSEGRRRPVHVAASSPARRRRRRLAARRDASLPSRRPAPVDVLRRQDLRLRSVDQGPGHPPRAPTRPRRRRRDAMEEGLQSAQVVLAPRRSLLVGRVLLPPRLARLRHGRIRIVRRTHHVHAADVLDIRGDAVRHRRIRLLSGERVVGLHELSREVRRAGAGGSEKSRETARIFGAYGLRLAAPRRGGRTRGRGRGRPVRAEHRRGQKRDVHADAGDGRGAAAMAGQRQLDAKAKGARARRFAAHALRRGAVQGDGVHDARQGGGTSG